MADTIKVNGLKELEKTLKELPGRLGEKVLRAALRRAANVIKKDAQNRVPVLASPTKYRNSGTVKNAIKVRKSKTAKYGVYVGVKPLTNKKILEYKAAGGKSNQNPNDPYYWWQLEFGNANMAARPFLRPAFEANTMKSLDEFEKYAKERVVKEAEKLAKEKGMK